MNNASPRHQLFAYMNVDEIETFLCVAELGNFSKASLKLHRTQPAISRRIALLEQSLGAALFERAARSAKLTRAGQAFLPHAIAVLAAIRDGRRAVTDAKRAPSASRHLSLAIVGTLADSHIVETLRTFQASAPGASVALTTATSREVSELVKAGDVELGLRYFPDTDPALECETLGTERLYLIVPARHAARARRVRGLQAFARENWLGFPKDRAQPESYGHLLERELRACGIAEPRITAVDSLTAQKRLIQAGFGVSLMSLSSCREELKMHTLRAIEVTSLRAELPVVALRRRDGYLSTLAEAFLRLLRRHHGLPEASQVISTKRAPARKVRRKSRR
jgi:DNA-binding transcriptional LysR family regulator